MTDGDTNVTRNESISALVKSSIEQAQKSHLTYVEISERVRPETVDASEIEFNERALDLAKYDTEETFKLALKLTDMSDEQEAVALRDKHIKAQNEEMAKRVAELQILAQGKTEPSPTDNEPAAELIVSEVAAAEPDEKPMAQAAVSSAALAGIVGAAAATAAMADKATIFEAPELDAAAVIEEVTAPDETISEASMEAEIQALASKIHDVENVKNDTPEVRDFDSENVELISDNSVLEEAPEVEVAAPMVEEIAQIEVGASVVEEIAQIEVGAPVVEEIAEVEVGAPIAEEIAEVEVGAPVAEEIADIEVDAPVAEEIADIEVVAPVVEEVADIEVGAPVVEEIADIEVDAPVVEEIADIEIVAPVAEEIADIEVVAPVVEEVAEVEVGAPVAEEIADIEVVAPVVEEVAEVEVGAPVAEEIADIEVAAPIVEKVSDIEVDTPVAEEIPDIEIVAPVAEQVAEAAAPTTPTAIAVPKGPAIDPETFDTDLSARLDAVRAMLQGSS